MPDFGGIISYLVFDLAIPFLFTVSFVVMIWGAFQYFIAGTHDEEAREKGKSLIFYGLLTFGAMVIIWGIISIVTSHLTS